MKNVFLAIDQGQKSLKSIVLDDSINFPRLMP